MLEFRQDVGGILRRVAKGERFILSHRGRPAARLEPLVSGPEGSANDPFLTISQRATASPRGSTKHEEMDRILYA
jgi:antitoxin (DNA-binding transcriptional repressor) of toxin-antitoxin stability system